MDRGAIESPSCTVSLFDLRPPHLSRATPNPPCFARGLNSIRRSLINLLDHPYTIKVVGAIRARRQTNYLKYAVASHKYFFYHLIVNIHSGRKYVFADMWD